jgi:hypothetical protein
MKSFFKAISLIIIISMLLLAVTPCIAFAETKVYSLRGDFDQEKNDGPIWLYQMYQNDTKKYINLDEYKEAWFMYVSKLPGYEIGGVGNGSWCPFTTADAVATFVSPSTGTALITADQHKDSLGRSKGNAWLWNGGDGARIKIMINDTKAWPTDKDWFDLAPIKANTIPDIKLNFKKGDKVYFHLNAGPAGDMNSDNLNWWLNVKLTSDTAQGSTASTNNQSTAATQSKQSNTVNTEASSDKSDSIVANTDSKNNSNESNTSSVMSEKKNEEKSGSNNSIIFIIIALIVVLCGAGVFVFTKMKKQ